MDGTLLKHVVETVTPTGEWVLDCVSATNSEPSMFLLYSDSTVIRTGPLNFSVFLAKLLLHTSDVSTKGLHLFVKVCPEDTTKFKCEEMYQKLYNQYQTVDDKSSKEIVAKSGYFL